MLDAQFLAADSSNQLNAGEMELDQRLGLYRVFLKLYEHNRGLLDEILDLENADARTRNRVRLQYIQAVVQGNQAYFLTNLIKEQSQAILQPQNIWLIGRDRRVALSISDRRLSRRHAAIQYLPDQGFYLIDLNSTNGSYVNGEQIRQPTLLKDGDQLRLGSLSFRFFVCQNFQMADEILPENLTQIQQAYQTESALEEKELAPQDSPATPIGWDTPLTQGADETFSLSEMPVVPVALPPVPKELPVNPALQADILDRFFERQNSNSR
jgi:hypothetical protein